MFFRFLILLLITAGGVWTADSVFQFNWLELLVLILVLSPIAILSKSFQDIRNETALSKGLVFFNKHLTLFKTLQFAFYILLLVGLYYFYVDYGLVTTLIYFACGSLLQSSYYTVLKIFYQERYF